MKTFAILTLALTSALALSAQAGIPRVFRYQAKVLDTQGWPLPGAAVECFRTPDWPTDSGTELQLYERGTTDAQGNVCFTTTNHGSFPFVSCRGSPANTRAAWGAAALPWLIPTDKAHHITAEGFEPDEVEGKLKAAGP